MTDGGGRMSAVMQELVSDAHSARDGVFNTLDAVGRRTRAANAVLAERVRALPQGRPEQPAEQSAEQSKQSERSERSEQSEQSAAQPAAARDTRFDPEDEWELPAPEAGPVRPPASRPRGDEGDDGGDDMDDAEFSRTWLR